MITSKRIGAKPTWREGRSRTHGWSPSGGGVTYRAVSSSSSAAWSPSSCAAWSLAALRPAAPRFFFFLELCPIGQDSRSASASRAAGDRPRPPEQTAAEAGGDGWVWSAEICARWRPWRGVGRRRGFAVRGLGSMGARRLDSSATAEWAQGGCSRWRRDFPGFFLATPDGVRDVGRSRTSAVC